MRVKRVAGDSAGEEAACEGAGRSATAVAGAGGSRPGDYFAIACDFISCGIFSMAYRNEVRGMTALFFITYWKTSC